MLYHLYDWQHAMMSPSRMIAETLQHVFSHPMLPISYTKLGRAIAAGSEIFERSTRRYKKPEFGLHHTTIDGEVVDVEIETVARLPFCNLLHFVRHTERKDPKLLLVAPLSGHYATLLRGTVEALLPQHDVYITDWNNACEVPAEQGRFDLDDYIDYLIGFLRQLAPDVHMMAVCQPSVPVLAAVSIMSAENDPAVPRSMTLMGGPIDTRVNPTQVNKLAAHRSIEWFEHSVITRVPATYPGFMRRVYPGFLQLTGFMTMNLDRHFGSTVRHFQHMVRGDGDSAAGHRKFYDEYLSVMDLTAEFYLQTIKTAFQDHALPLGTMVSRGRPVDPRAIRRTALMTVEGELDDISGVGQTFAAHGLCSILPPAKRKHLLQKQVGHFGIFNGKKWRGEILPQVTEFIRANQGQAMKRAG
jgi:poly(3-hydroxybutyrate) depolymerase